MSSNTLLVHLLSCWSDLEKYHSVPWLQLRLDYPSFGERSTLPAKHSDLNRVAKGHKAKILQFPDFWYHKQVCQVIGRLSSDHASIPKHPQGFVYVLSLWPSNFWHIRYKIANEECSAECLILRFSKYGLVPWEGGHANSSHEDDPIDARGCPYYCKGDGLHVNWTGGRRHYPFPLQ